MTGNNRSLWLVAYDIRAPRRLRRVHKYVSHLGHALQYSLFVADLNPAEVMRAKAEISDRANPGRDDVRFYCLPRDVRGSWAGPLPRSADIAVFGSPAAGLARKLAQYPLDGTRHVRLGKRGKT